MAVSSGVARQWRGSVVAFSMAMASAVIDGPRPPQVDVKTTVANRFDSDGIVFFGFVALDTNTITP